MLAMHEATGSSPVPPPTPRSRGARARRSVGYPPLHSKRDERDAPRRDRSPESWATAESPATERRRHHPRATGEPVRVRPLARHERAISSRPNPDVDGGVKAGGGAGEG